MAAFVIVLGFAAMAAVGAVALTRSGVDDAPAREGKGAGGALVVAALVALVVGAATLRFGGSDDVRRRAAAALGGATIGVGGALGSLWARQRLGAPGSLRSAAAATVASLAIAAASAASLGAWAVRVSAASVDALARVLSGWALGAALVGVVMSIASSSAPDEEADPALDAARGPDAFPVAAVAIAAATIASGAVAAQNATSLRAAALDPAALVALGPLLAVLAAASTAIGAASVRADEGEPPDAPVVRGFVVATVIGMLAAMAAGHWWARPPGRGGWLALAGVTGAIGAWLVLLLGRYHDDPTHRPARALADARGMDAQARWTTGAVVGVEGFVAVVAVAAVVSLAAMYTAEHLGLEGAHASGVAVAIGAVIAAWGFLRAVADGGHARTLAHDTLLLSLAAVAFARRGRVAVIAAGLAAVALLVAAMLERTAAAQPGVDGGASLRRRAATMSLLAASILAGGGTIATLVRET